LYRAVDGVTSIRGLLKKTKMDTNEAIAMLLAWRDMLFIRLPSKETAQEPVRETRNDESAAIRELEMCAEKSKKQNHFEIFGLTEKATTEDVKRVYLELARKFHPDRLPKGISPALRTKASEYFGRVTEAQSILMNPTARADYIQTLSLKESGITAESARKAIESEFEFQKGLAALRKGSFGAAVENFQQAISLYDAEAEYWVHLGWALFRHNSKNGSVGSAMKAKELIHQGLKKNESLPEAYYFLGMIAKAQGELDMSKKHFQQVLHFKPNHTQAESELRLMNMRQKNVKSGFGGLFR
jgi:curved DNA-binding protein CbpA